MGGNYFEESDFETTISQELGCNTQKRNFLVSEDLKLIMVNSDFFAEHSKIELS